MGKTTTIGKLARRLRTEGNQTVLMAACDTFRAAANEQIKTWSERLGLDIITSHYKADAASVAFDAYQAGDLATPPSTEMMNETYKIQY